METPLAIFAGVLFGSAVWLMLSGNLLRFLFGLLLMSNGVNVAIFSAGRLTQQHAPFLDQSGLTPSHEIANALPQALLLTAIVIGFGLFAFAITLTLRAYRNFGHLELDKMRAAEPEETSK